MRKEEFISNNHVTVNLGNTDYVNFDAKKVDGSSEKLTLKVMKGDEVIEEKKH